MATEPLDSDMQDIITSLVIAYKDEALNAPAIYNAELSGSMNAIVVKVLPALLISGEYVDCIEEAYQIAARVIIMKKSICLAVWSNISRLEKERSLKYIELPMTVNSDSPSCVKTKEKIDG